MQSRRREVFTTIRTEGGLLPADLLQRIVAADKNLEGLTPQDYHLAPGEKINEAVNRSWNRLLGLWEAFRAAAEKLPTGDPGTSVTRERCLLPLFQELGYGRLRTAPAIEVDGKTYPVSHLWGHAPIHLVGCRVELDRPTRGVAGAARSSPHSLVQELLNRSDDHLWAFVSNGKRLRILRDNKSLTRQSYVEFDLEAMLEGEVYADFVLLWLLCHQSRVEAERPEQCWLEKWSKAAQEQGTRALDQLRNGVEEAITALGRGFLTHPLNRVLKDSLRSGALSTQEYYRQLLRIVYRLLFLFVAEDRELLLDPNAAPEARDRYLRYYATTRLRRLAERQRGTRHSDLYHGLRLVLDHLYAGCPALGLPPLGSFLFSPKATPDLNGGEIANHDLLEAIRALAFTLDANIRRPVDYKNLRSEELGSVYEALLELHPELSVDAGTFALHTAGGSERKTTGSYYTPDSLVQCLLDSALDPVLDAAVSGEWAVGSREKTHGNRIVSRSSGLATGHESGRSRLPSDADISEGRSIWNDRSDSTGSIGDPREHSGRLREGDSRGISAVPENSPGESEGVGDTPSSLIQGAALPHGDNAALAGSGGNTGQDAPRPDSQTSGQTIQHSTPGVIPAAHSPLTTPEDRLLALKVCDPACGSGHFLIAAAHRMAKRLASVRTGDEEPSPDAVRTALRDIIGRCVYGVDINPMAVELCKVALWMEALEPGKPLSFLDHHIQCGNSLLGTTPALLEEGLPDGAFEPIEGDDRAVCAEFKRKNRQEREGQGALFDANLQPWERLGDLATGLIQLNTVPDDTLEGVQQRQAQYERLVRSQAYENGRLLADAWCAAFVWKKTRDGDRYPLTTAHLRRLLHNPYSLESWMREEIERLARQYRFFHWHLAFPEVFLRGSGEWGVGSGDSGLPVARSQETEGRKDGVLSGLKGVAGGDDAGRGLLSADAAVSEGGAVRDDRTDTTRRVLRSGEHSRGVWSGGNEGVHPLSADSARQPEGAGDASRSLTAGGTLHRGAGSAAASAGRVAGADASQPDSNTPAKGHVARDASTPHSPLPTPFSGFDVLLGNPPWERVKLQEKEWFAVRRPDIANAPNAAQRKQLIAALKEEDPALYQAFLEDRRKAEGESHLLRQSGRYPLCGRGDVNTYAVFAELFRSLLAPRGRAGIIVPTGIATDDTTKAFFADLTDTQTLGSLYDFENRRIFPNVHASFKFCLLTMNGARRPAEQGAEFVFFAHSTDDLRDPERRFTLSAADIALLNPNTKTCPVFRSRRDADITKGIYRRVPVLINEAEPANPWGVEFMRMLDMASDSKLFRNAPAPGLLPLYEAKMLHHFNHRWATYVGSGEWGVGSGEWGVGSRVASSAYSLKRTAGGSRHDAGGAARPALHRHAPLLGGCRRGGGAPEKARPRGQRHLGVEARLAPRLARHHQYDQRAHRHRQPPPPRRCRAYLSFDVSGERQRTCYRLPPFLPLLLRARLRRPPEGRGNSPYLWLSQPVAGAAAGEVCGEWGVGSGEWGSAGEGQSAWKDASPLSFLAPRVLELVYTAYDMAPFAQDMLETTTPHSPLPTPFPWNETRRFLLRCELDALYFHLYGIAREDVDYIMETFPIVKRKDEEVYGEYRTKRVILEIYDALQQAMETGVPYRTRLDPPPANGWTPQVVDSGEWLVAGKEKALSTSHQPLTTTEELTLVAPPTPPPTLAIGVGEVKNDLSARVRVNGRLGVLLAETPSGDGRTIVVAQFDGETKPRKFFSPPAVVERIGTEAR